MKKRTERTSKRVAVKASALLKKDFFTDIRFSLNQICFMADECLRDLDSIEKDLKSIAGSALTQREKK